MEELYRGERTSVPEQDTRVAELYEGWLESVGEEKARPLLHTQYHAIEKNTNGLSIKWWGAMWLWTVCFFAFH